MIVFSYRRADSAGLVRALRERLVHQLGAERVFLDVETIGAGADFRAVLTEAVRRCEALLVVIGPHWLEAEDGTRRLDEPDDVVRLEIATALEAGVPIVPVLVDGARMPGAADLPEPLRALANRNAVEITNARFDTDAERLLRGLAPPRPFPVWTAVLAIAGLALLVAYAVRAASWPYFVWGLLVLAAIPAVALLPILRRRLPATGPARSLAAGLCLAAFALLVVGGLAVRAEQAATPFALSVRVIDRTSSADDSLVGEVELEYDGDRLRSPIGPGATARFDRVAGIARGRDVRLIPQVEGYRADTTVAQAVADAIIDVALVELPIATLVRGFVVDGGRRPLAGVMLDFGDGEVTTVSDEEGSFTVNVPWNPGESVLLRATLHGVVGYERHVTIPLTSPLNVPFTTAGG